MNLVQLLSQNFAKYSSKPVIVFGENTWTYQDLEDQIRDYASLLNQIGIKKGDRIAIQMPKSVEFLFLHLAILSIGAISLPLNPDYRGSEIVYFLSDSSSNLFITTSDRLAQFQTEIQHLSNLQIILADQNSNPEYQPNILGSLLELVAQSPKEFVPTYSSGGNDIAMICYTSGTTGRSKGAMISHRNLIANMEALHEAWQWQDSDRLLHVLPLFHVHGLNVAVLGCLYAGATMIMVEKFEPRSAWRALEREQISIFMAVPTIYQRLISSWQDLESTPDLSKMRLFISGSAPLSDRQFDDFEKLTDFRILERYGMTETGMNASNPIDPKQRLPKSVGFPLKGVEILIVDSNGKSLRDGEVGEVWIRGENVFQGYWQMPDKTKESFVDGWFRSGDLGYVDPQGRLYLVSRAKELIITGGFNVYPKEIENILESHKSVKESAVIGIPDQDFGEKVVAAIAFHEGLQVPLEDLIGHCKVSLASYKCPKQVFEVSEIPRNAMGKIQKHLLKIGL
ncbi:MAG: o-succinylbenzoate--CoA ligase [Pseudanabaena sp.]|nr:MAG: o-succinylbenzoate--CoA ligase [Pseudanabaena sp.]